MLSKVYNYFDGSGNKYVIKDEDGFVLEYIPVKPTQSSSGIYDGGEHVIKELDKIQFNKLTSLLETAIQKTDSHIKNRIMMSGMIMVHEDNERERCIIRPKSEILKRIEDLLHSLIS